MGKGAASVTLHILTIAACNPFANRKERNTNKTHRHNWSTYKVKTRTLLYMWTIDLLSGNSNALKIAPSKSEMENFAKQQNYHKRTHLSFVLLFGRIQLFGLGNCLSFISFICVIIVVCAACFLLFVWFQRTS